MRVCHAQIICVSDLKAVTKAFKTVTKGQTISE